MTSKPNVADFFGQRVRDTLSEREREHIPQHLLDAVWQEPSIGQFRACIKEQDGADCRLLACLLVDDAGNPVATEAGINELRMRASVPLLRTSGEVTEWLIRELAGSGDEHEGDPEGKPAG